MRTLINIAGTILIFLSITASANNTSPFFQRRMPSWQEIISATTRVLVNNLPLTENDKGFKEMVELLHQEDDDPRLITTYIKEIKKESESMLIIYPEGIGMEQKFSVIFSDDSKKEVKVSDYNRRIYILFLRQKVLSYSFSLLILGVIFQIISIMKLPFTVSSVFHKMKSLSKKKFQDLSEQVVEYIKMEYKKILFKIISFVFWTAFGAAIALLVSDLMNR